MDPIGEEIDFGADIWWLEEGYVGRYEMTEEDLEDMKSSGLIRTSEVDKKGDLLEIGKDGKIRFDYFSRVYEGRIQLYSRGLPAMNEPSKQPTITVTNIQPAVRKSKTIAIMAKKSSYMRLR